MMKLTATMIVWMLTLSIFCVAFYHEVNGAEGVKTGTLSMKRQHEAMESLDRQWTKVEDAVKKGDFGAASRSIAFIEERLTPDIARFHPHRNAEKLDQYRLYHEDFVQSLKRLRAAVVTKDATRAAPELVKGVADSCEQCHDTFAGGHH
jgi:phosphoribosylaminoimidazole-succinocarboxamide synthase